jgi:hypothetical protein
MSALNQWFKFYGAEYLSDPKMDRLSVQERSCWLTILCMASQGDGKIKFLSVESLLNKSGIHFNPYDSQEWDKACGVLKTFEQYEMIKIDNKGVIEVLNWNKRQNTAMTGYERVKKYRKNMIKMGNDNEMITDDNGDDNDRGDKIRGEENIIINNIGGNTPLTKVKKFIKPTLDEIKTYCSERSNSINPQKFIDFYESKGWLIGKNSMKDWKAAVRTWEGNGFGNQKQSAAVLHTDQGSDIVRAMELKAKQNK